MVNDQESGVNRPFKTKVVIDGVMHDMYDGPCVCGAWHEGAADILFMDLEEDPYFKKVMPDAV